MKIIITVLGVTMFICTAAFAQVADDDKDGVPNNLDECPTVHGAASNKGCPEKKGDKVLKFKDGFNIHSSSDGSQYKGIWVNNKKNGRGVQTWLNGDKYEGFWKNDLFDGFGIFIKKDGTINEGVWEAGKLINDEKTVKNLYIDDFEELVNNSHILFRNFETYLNKQPFDVNKCDSVFDDFKTHISKINSQLEYKEENVNFKNEKDREAFVYIAFSLNALCEGTIVNNYTSKIEIEKAKFKLNIQSLIQELEKLKAIKFTKK